MKNYIQAQLENYIAGRELLIIGFGREGRSTYQFLRQYFPLMPLAIADSNPQIATETVLLQDANLKLIIGSNYLDEIASYELIFKSPGVSFKDYVIPANQEVSSQTDLFFYLFSDRCIGITGTKGKSTTSTLIYHLLQAFYDSVILLGNIGIPALDKIEVSTEDTLFVYELSSHQLEFVKHSPKIAVLLNLHQEHLDHYNSYDDYRQSKWNICKYQKAEDCFVYCADETQLMQDLKRQKIVSHANAYGDSEVANFQINKQGLAFYNKQLLGAIQLDKFPLIGSHNLLNLMASLAVCQFMNLPFAPAWNRAMSFKGLPHRLEFAGEIQGVKFYNDSIATIPQATIKALESLNAVETLVLGGFDRGIDYQLLIDYLLSHKPINLLMIGKVGERLSNYLQKANYKGLIISVPRFDAIISLALQYTASGNICLLSPAAASYDSFKNFEERGNLFKSLIVNYQSS
jgi:UDP-N-acetylmuramoylalanine--D-glutamate ligase